MRCYGLIHLFGGPELYCPLFPTRPDARISNFGEEV